MRCINGHCIALHSNRVFKFRPVQYINLIEFKSIELEVKMKSSGVTLELDSHFSFVRRTVKNFIASVDILFLNKILNWLSFKQFSFLDWQILAMLLIFLIATAILAGKKFLFHTYFVLIGCIKSSFLLIVQTDPILN